MELQAKIAKLEGQLEANKVFTYMVIHDLKHPTEAVISQLDIFKDKINSGIESSF
jgi:hypothetical protein